MFCSRRPATASWEGDMPVRKVHNRGENIIGKFPSLKMKRMVSFESTIERDYLYLLDYEADITHFEEQPLTIESQRSDCALRRRIVTKL
jgi:hypothetical protein